MSTITNAPESINFSMEDHQIFEAARVAVASLSKTFELWMTVARGVELARAKADRIGRRNAFQRILEQQGLAAVLGKEWPAQKSTASKLLMILKRLPEVTVWRETLDQHYRIAWAAPTTIYKHCPLFQPLSDVEDKDEDESEDKAETRDPTRDSEAIIAELRMLLRHVLQEVPDLPAGLAADIKQALGIADPVEFDEAAPELDEVINRVVGVKS
jgi:hypothetical protein